MKLEKPILRSTKNYGSEVGFSTCFRQWRANSHCKFLHGYALGFRFVFEATELDKHGWVQDFGGLKPLKSALEMAYDHRLVVAEDDPQRSEFLALELAGAAAVRVVPAVGCEAFARHAFYLASAIVNNERVRVISCECYEHSGNSAIYLERPSDDQ